MATWGAMRSGGTVGAAPAAGGGLPGGYQSAYNAALAQNQQLYQNVLGGYRDVLAQQRRETAPILAGYGDLQKAVQGQYADLASGFSGAANAARVGLAETHGQVQAGYGNLYNDVLGQINSIGGAQQQAITDQYAQAAGRARMGLMNAGLGNTTVTSAVNRGLTFDEAKARTDLTDRLAGLRASSMQGIMLPALAFQERAGQAQADLLTRAGEFGAGLGRAGVDDYGRLGLAGLGYGGQVQSERNRMEQSYLDFAGSPSIPYPDPSPYLQQQQLAYQMQQDQLAQQEAKRAADMAIAMGLRQTPGPGGGVGMGTGYMPSAGPAATPGGVVPLAGAGGGMMGYDNMNTAAGLYSNLLGSSGGYGRGYAGDAYAPKLKGGPPAGYAAAEAKAGPSPYDEAARYLGNPFV